MRSEYSANLQLQPVAQSTAAPANHMVSGKRGAVHYPLGEQIASTAQVHGVSWCAAYYARAGVPLGEFLVLARGAGVLQ